MYNLDLEDAPGVAAGEYRRGLCYWIAVGWRKLFPFANLPSAGTQIAHQDLGECWVGKDLRLVAFVPRLDTQIGLAAFLVFQDLEEASFDPVEVVRGAAGWDFGAGLD